MKKIIPNIIGILLLSISLFSQNFTFHSETPFGIEINDPGVDLPALQYMFADLDQDEDFDLLLSGIGHLDISEGINSSSFTFFLAYQENIGSVTDPNFNRWTYISDFTFPRGFFFPAAGDLNNDGLVDLLASAEVDSLGGIHLLYYRNRGSNKFDKIDLADMDLIPFLPSSFLFPYLIDLDSDGDLDILVSGIAPAFDSLSTTENVIYYAKNIGNKDEPRFLGWFEDPYGLNGDILNTGFVGGDLDKDGDTDLLSIQSSGDFTSLLFAENLSTSNVLAHFGPSVESPMGLPLAEIDETFLSSSLVDIDGDGDLDFFMFKLPADANIENSSEGSFLYFENQSSTTSTDNPALKEDIILLAPNPTSHQFSVLNKSNLKIRKISIYNSSGQMVHVIHGNSHELIDIKNLNYGAYIALIEMGDKVIMKKLLIIK